MGMEHRTPIESHEPPNGIVVPRRRQRRFWPHLLLFAASIVLVNGLFGERGLMETIRARRAHGHAAEELARLRRENAALRERVRRLRDDPATIEAVARRELGLLRRGEILVTVKDAR
jgi:cell division protein FtsB